MSAQSNTYRVFHETVDGLNELLGRLGSWMTLFMVLLQAMIIGMRYIFGANELFDLPYIWWQEMLNMYLQGALILLGASYTLLHNGHVRVDIFYGSMSERGKYWVDLFGSVMFLLPVSLFIIWAAWPDMMAANWSQGEGTQNPGGPRLVQWLRFGVVAMGALLALQAVSNAIKCVIRLRGGEIVEDPYYAESALDEIDQTKQAVVSALGKDPAADLDVDAPR